MRILHTPVYQFSELSESAKESAREWFRTSDEFHADCSIDDATECASILGLDVDKIYYSGFGSQGDGACFVGSYRYAAGSAKAIRQHAPQDTRLHAIADRLQRAQRSHFYKLCATITHRDMYCHARSMDISVDAETTIPDAVEKEIAECLRDFADWIYSQIEAEFYDSRSDECVDSTIEANEYEFTIAGRRIRS